MSQDYSTLASLIPDKLSRLDQVSCLLGFDGTVDFIYKPIETRTGPGDNFTPFPSIRKFGERIIEADNKSALIEIVQQHEQIGGNGPIMAKALASSNLNIHYIGTLGYPDINPAYSTFTQNIHCQSIAEPAITRAMEFDNGKIMLTSCSNYEQVTASTLKDIVGLTNFSQLISESHLFCLLNWTCLPGLNSILDLLLEKILPEIEPNHERIFFFDLADPTMHSASDLLDVLNLIRRFTEHGHTVLGMNFNEAQQVSKTLSIATPEPNPDSLCKALETIRETLGIQTVMAHPVDFAACATAEGSWTTYGPYTHKPKITTGAGDHLNAGFCLGLLLGFKPETAIQLGVLYSGFYVRNAKPPQLKDIPDFIHSL